MFNNRKQSVPNLFKEIMNIHTKQDELRAAKVVNFLEYRDVYDILGRYRRAAADFLRRKGNNNGAI